MTKKKQIAIKRAQTRLITKMSKRLGFKFVEGHVLHARNLNLAFAKLLAVIKLYAKTT